jgi:hypothetical protein
VFDLFLINTDIGYLFKVFITENYREIIFSVDKEHKGSLFIAACCWIKTVENVETVYKKELYGKKRKNRGKN